MRFTAEGYPQQQQQQQQLQLQQQFPSPPDGYKSSDLPMPTFQQWPSCLPGYHAQPLRYNIAQSPTQAVTATATPAPTLDTSNSNSNSSCNTNTSNSNNTANGSATIPELDESETSPSGSNEA